MSRDIDDSSENVLSEWLHARRRASRADEPEPEDEPSSPPGDGSRHARRGEP